MVRQTLCLKMADKYHQHLSGGIVEKWQKFLPFSNNHNQLFENGRKQTINNFVGTLLENGRNFRRFPTTGFRPFSNNPKCFGRFPTKRFRPFSTSPLYVVGFEIPEFLLACRIFFEVSQFSFCLLKKVKYVYSIVQNRRAFLHGLVCLMLIYKICDMIQV